MAAGLPKLQPGQRLREDDVEILAIIASAKSAGISEDSLARVLRVFGQNARRVAQTMRDLFRDQVEEPLVAGGLSPREALERAAELRLGLQRLGFRTLFLLQRRLLEELVFDNGVSRVQDAFLDAGQAGLLNREPKSVAFVDISGFTALIGECGDERAAECAARLEALAHDAAVQNGGHSIKSLGDGVMMLFRDAGRAAEACLSLIDNAPSEGLPALAAGIATGSVIPQDGDVFGATVDLAARIAAEARGGQLLVCPDTRSALAAASPATFLLHDHRSVALQGFPTPVELTTVAQVHDPELSRSSTPPMT
jgi:class 3 adenylate cyclase